MSEGAPLTHLEARVLAAIERHVRAEGVAPTIAELASDLRLKSKGTVHRYVQSLIAKGRLERQGNGWRGLRIVGLQMPGARSNVHPFPQRRRTDQVVPLHDRTQPAGGEPGLGKSAGKSADKGAEQRVASLVGPPASAEASNVGAPLRLPTDRPRTSQGDEPDGHGGGHGGGQESGEGGGDAVELTTLDPLRIPLLGRIAAGLPIEAIEDQRYLDLAAFFIGPDRYALRVTGDSMIEAGILDGDTVILRKQETARVGDIVVALIDGQEATLKRLGEIKGGTVELIPENASMQPLRYAASRVSFQGVLVGQLRNY